MKKFFYIATLLLAGTFSAALAIDGIYFDRSLDELKTEYTNADSKFISVAGMSVHYRDQGQGPNLILLHGVNASLHTWESWVEVLSQNFRVISLDLPGFGLTGPDPLQRYRWKESAEFVNEFATGLGIDKYHLAGNSRGGAIALHVALLYPEKVNKLILIDAAGIPWEEPLPLALQLQGFPVIKQAATLITPKWFVNQSVASVYGDPNKIKSSTYTRYHDLLIRAGNREASSAVMEQTFDQELLYTQLPEIKHPTLIQWGEDDQWIRLKYGKRFHQLLPDSKLIVYPGVGHIPMEEIPQRSALDAKEFLL